MLINFFSKIFIKLLPVLLLFIGFFLALIALNNNSDNKLNDMAIGKEMKIFTDYYLNEDMVQCETFYLEKCITSGKKSKLRKVLWIGNSQLHTINKPDKMSKTAPALLIDRLYEKNIQGIAITQPNISLQDVNIIFEIVLNSMSIDTLILPLVFDDTREDNLDPVLKKIAERHKINNQYINSNKFLLNKVEEKKIVKNDVNLQAISEDNINKFLSKYIPLIEERKNFRGNVNYFLYKLRNSLLGINSQSKRKLLEIQYKKNFTSLWKLLDKAEKKNIKVLAYIAPIRNDFEIPYYLHEYKKFKEDTELLLKRYSQNFFNLEDIIEGDYWGEADTISLFDEVNIDFMHFDSTGHIKLENEISKILFEKYL